jgi:propanol-preferring alcohol dehydrogenase
MRAARLHEYTDDMSNGLSIDEVDKPQVEHSDDVIVAVEGAGWCQTDNHIIEGMWEQYVPQPLPMTLGHENAGTVVEVGEERVDIGHGDVRVAGDRRGYCQPPWSPLVRRGHLESAS